MKRHYKFNFQSIFNSVLYLLGGIVFLGSILGGIKNSLELFSKTNSIIWSLGLFFTWLSLYFFLKIKSPEWIINKQKIRITRPNKQINLFFLGMILIVWTPFFINKNELEIQIVYPYENMETLGTFEMKWKPFTPGLVTIKNSLNQTTFSSETHVRPPFVIENLLSGEDYQLILKVENTIDIINFSVIEDPRGHTIHEAGVIIEENPTHVIEGGLSLPFMHSTYLEIYLNDSIFKIISGQALERPHQKGSYCNYIIANESILRELVNENNNLKISIKGYSVNQSGEVHKLNRSHTLTWKKYEDIDYYIASFHIKIFYTINGECKMEVS